MTMQEDIIEEAQFWFERTDGKRYYAKQVEDDIILLNSHDCGEKMRFSVDKYYHDLKNGKIIDYGIE